MLAKRFPPRFTKALGFSYLCLSAGKDFSNPLSDQKTLRKTPTLDGAGRMMKGKLNGLPAGTIGTGEGAGTARSRPETPQAFACGRFVVLPELNRLVGEEPLELEPRWMDTLVYLARHRARVVSVDDLMADVWHGRLVTGSALYKTIGELRRCLGDDARQPTYIETVRKRGYRLIAAVSTLSGPTDPSPWSVATSRNLAPATMLLN